MFEPVKKKSFPEIEAEMLDFWEARKIFDKVQEARKDAPHFSTFDGPAFATGSPHYGHLLAGTIKDVVLRYMTMKGFYVRRRIGWDCHGLPVEQLVEKQEGLSGAASIESYGIARFNEACERVVVSCEEIWPKTIKKMGRWADFNDTYRTMDLDFMESVWWIFKQLYEKKLVYEGFRVLPFSAKLGTPLSNFEAGQNYQEVDDPSITLRLPLVGQSDTALLVWTTTPWTLVSNLAAMVGPEIVYAKVYDRIRDHTVILAKERLASYLPSNEDYELLDTFAGSQLIGQRYEPPFGYFADREAFRVIAGKEVSTQEGTGIVHAAPAFGEADFFACKEAGIDLVCPVDTNGQFTDEIPEYCGQLVKDTDKEIIHRLKEAGRLYHQGTIRHRYPFCWRSDTPLIYRAMSTWLVAVEQARDQLLAVNEQIHWVPGHIKQGRFGKWLAQARDWNIARNRYFGTPIPLWRSDDGEMLALGSVAELEAFSGVRVTDLHRQTIDAITFEHEGKVYRRIPEVFDCWFESGSVPYGHHHYPFENKELVEAQLPGDFIAEGLDQTRAWFYTLTVLSTLLFNRPAFKHVIVNGIVLAEDGAKMSKRLKNYPDPDLVISRYGADAIRLYLLHSPAVRGDDLRFSEKGVELVMRQILLPLWNAFTFFVTYARIYDWKPPKLAPRPKLDIDRWMLSKLHQLVHDVRSGMDSYELNRAVEPFVYFIDELTNWYIRLNRRRFWEKGRAETDDEAFALLYHVTLTLTQIAAPFTPFLSEAIYRHLRRPGDPESVHLLNFPEYDEKLRDYKLESEMAAVQRAVSLGHALRKEHRVKVRQPLLRAHIVSSDPELLEALQGARELIARELNVREVSYSADEKAFVRLSAKPNFRVLGKRLGGKMRAVQRLVTDFGTTELNALANGKRVTLAVDGEEVVLKPEEIELVRSTKSDLPARTEGMLTMALELTLTEELELEGIAREFVNRVSTLRREAELEYTDRIELSVKTTDRARTALETHRGYVENELLATRLAFISTEGSEFDLNGERAVIAMVKSTG